MGREFRSPALINICTVLVLRMAQRKWKDTKLQPGVAGPGNMLGCCLISFHFLWAILSTNTVLTRERTTDADRRPWIFFPSSDLLRKKCVLSYLQPWFIQFPGDGRVQCPANILEVRFGILQNLRMNLPDEKPPRKHSKKSLTCTGSD